jgi:hypothetical protein
MGGMLNQLTVKSNRDQKDDKLVPDRDAERHANEYAMEQDAHFKH